jgi:hypothetical protein
MSDELKALVFDGLTGAGQERPFTQDEATQYLAMQESFLEYINAKDAKAVARESALAKLAALGLTEAEIAAL